MNDEKFVTTAIIIIAGFTDWADGYFARKRNEITELGKILDPLGDKLCLAALIIPMILQNYIPLWFALVVIGRDFIILLGGLYIKNRTKIVIASNMLGKITFVILGLIVLSVYLELPNISQLGFLIATFFVVISLVSYLTRGIKVLRNFNFKE